MLGFRIFGPRTISEQESFVQLFVDQVLVDRLGTLGAPNRIDDDVVEEFLEADQIGDHVLGYAKLFLCPNAPGEADDTIANRHLDIIRIEKELLLESVADERAQLIVAQVVGISDVLVVLCHTSSGCAHTGAVEVTGRTAAMRRESEPDCSSRMNGPGRQPRQQSRRWESRSTRSDTSTGRGNRSSRPSAGTARPGQT